MENLDLKWFKKEGKNIDLEETKRRIKIFQRKIYKCCGTKQNLCLQCFGIYHRLEDLKEYRKKLKKEVRNSPHA